jgi:prepilin-type N-terminal cleavage/methylation domain-containing protein
MNKSKGFTFIELLVVITIMAVIFAAGIVSYTTISKNSRDARRMSDLEAIRQALEMCRSIDGVYPNETPDGIYPASGSVECETSGTVTLKATPHDPKPCTGHTDGKYTYDLTAGVYTLTADCAEGDAIVVTSP